MVLYPPNCKAANDVPLIRVIEQIQKKAASSGDGFFGVPFGAVGVRKGVGAFDILSECS